jgi:hypothetical protein
MEEQRLSDTIMNDLRKDTMTMQQLLQAMTNSFEMQPRNWYGFLREFQYHISLLDQRAKLLEQAKSLEERQKS